MQIPRLSDGLPYIKFGMIDWQLRSTLSRPQYSERQVHTGCAHARLVSVRAVAHLSGPPARITPIRPERA